MKNVVIKNSIFIISILFFSCHKTTNPPKTDKVTIDKVKPIGSSPIVTNSLDPNFIYDLIETQKVKKGDTVLFREWGNLEINPISIYNNKTKFEVFADTVVKFYKTGEEKFSKYRLTIVDKDNNKSFDVYGIVILNDFREPYHLEQSSSNTDIEKLSKTIGRLSFNCIGNYMLFVDFKVTNDALHIVQLSSEKYMREGIVKHKLDTLIVLRNKNSIYPDTLLFALNKKKNCIAGKDIIILR